MEHFDWTLATYTRMHTHKKSTHTLYTICNGLFFLSFFIVSWSMRRKKGISWSKGCLCRDDYRISFFFCIWIMKNIAQKNDEKKNCTHPEPFIWALLSTKLRRFIFKPIAGFPQPFFILFVFKRDERKKSYRLVWLHKWINNWVNKSNKCSIRKESSHYSVRWKIRNVFHVEKH